MFKIIIICVLVLVAETLGQRIIHPTWRPRPTRPIIIRTARDLSDNEPLWLYKGDNIDRAPTTGDHPVLPTIIDDIEINPNRRYARSVDSPSAKGSSHSSSSSSRDSGPTHPGYNRRNARDLLPAFRYPQPYRYDRPSLPTLPGNSGKPFPIYASTRLA